MRKTVVLLSLIAVLLAGLATVSHALASPSGGFHEVDGDVFDDWGICRTRAFGEDGFYQISKTTFRPVIVFESLGGNAALAYSLGQQMEEKYPDRVQRAEAVFHFVRDRVKYTPDIDRFDQEEFALNADELATSIDQNGAGYGDCEDSAVLLAVMYKGAGFRSAIVAGSGHTAALVYLPDYNKATVFFKLGGEPGWVWAEATGKNNPLGWASKEFVDVKLAAYEISEEEIAPAKPLAAPATAIAQTGSGISYLPFPFFSLIFFLWFISLFRRRRAG